MQKRAATGEPVVGSSLAFLPRLSRSLRSCTRQAHAARTGRGIHTRNTVQNTCANGITLCEQVCWVLHHSTSGTPRIDRRDECTMSIAVCILLVFRSFLDSAVSFVRGEVLSLRRARERAANEGARQREGARQKSVRAGAGGLGDNVIRPRPYTRCSQRLDDPCQRSVSVSGFTQYVQRHCLYAIWPRQGEVE